MVELCLHIANVVYLASFLGRDMLHLRILTCVGLVLGIVFFSCQATPLYGPTIWHLVFLGINSFQIVRLVLDRRKLALSREQERFGEAAFLDLSREELLNLLSHAMYERPDREWDIRQIGQTPLSQDEIVLRDLAFSNLTRKELLNLLTRRLWHSVARRAPSRRKWKRGESSRSKPWSRPGSLRNDRWTPFPSEDGPASSSSSDC